MNSTPNLTTAIVWPKAQERMTQPQLRPQAKLYLPMSILINNRFLIDLRKENYQTVKTSEVDCEVEYHIFSISALNLLQTDYKKKIEFKYGKSYYYYEPHMGTSILEKEIFARNTLQILNHIQYLLALPMEEIPLHLEEEGDMQALIMWRLDLPKETHAFPDISHLSIQL
jgi:hypothetical protein